MGESNSCHSLEAAQALPGARRRLTGRPETLRHHSPPTQPAASSNQVISRTLTPGALTFLPIGEGVMGHHAELLSGKSSKPTAAPVELAVPQSPQCLPFFI